MIGPPNDFGPFYAYIANSDHHAQAGGFWNITDPVPSEILRSVTCDAFREHNSNNLNVVMKVLTSLTILVALPNLIASFYGMNIGLPGQHRPDAFPIIATVS